MNKATTFTIEEIMNFAREILKRFEDKILISSETFMSFLSRVSEYTQSYMSEFHYGIYKATAKDLKIREALAKQLTLVSRSVVYPMK